mgnify:CR=1 FL=1
MKRILGFGTRNVTDNIIRPFVSNAGGIFHEKIDQVQPYLKTKYLSFNMQTREKWYKEKNDIVVCGILRGTERLMKEAEKREINYYYFDHAYFYRADAHKTHPVLNERFYRIVVNGQQLNTMSKLNDDDYKRIPKYQKKLAIDLDIRNPDKDDRVKVAMSNDGYILICPPSAYVCNFYGIKSAAAWLKDKTQEIIKHTDRQIIVREKTSNADLNDQIRGAWAVVTCQSTVAIKAIMSGVPSFCDEMSSALPLSLSDISMIENPRRPSIKEIENYKNNLLANQFTMTEISKGLVYDIVRRLQGNRFYGN